MPRGGRGEADDFSPYKTADGRELKLLKSSQSKTGYLCVVEIRKGKFYPKKKLNCEKGSKKQQAFGNAQPTARLAAIKLAEYLDEFYVEVPKATPCQVQPSSMNPYARVPSHACRPPLMDAHPSRVFRSQRRRGRSSRTRRSASASTSSTPRCTNCSGSSTSRSHGASSVSETQ